jgi:hypothetical protein
VGRCLRKTFVDIARMAVGFICFLSIAVLVGVFFLAYFVTTKPTKTLEGSIDCVQAFSFEK